ncbi:MAG: hypothetical protein NZ739_03825 [Verrucomicrobiae bacterium]|nr:hypothetical protein [Verrucomicrobiae bacterium]MCX7721662.1 hypothetical protein [Verrucomicrobiae bacterium]MDW7980586.1 hypothetical protein [Verrucomicrobiales bacterium]
MTLDDAQKKRVAEWVASGKKLSEIQDLLAREFGLRLTYMEVRLLLAELNLVPQEPEPPAEAKEVKPAEPEPARPAQQTGVKVTVDELAQPGALLSGKVTFSDGARATWYLDQFGRLGVVPEKQGYRPSATDMEQFQLALESELARLGY